MDMSRVQELAAEVRRNDRVAEAIIETLSSSKNCVQVVMPCGVSIDVVVDFHMATILNGQIGVLSAHRKAAIDKIRSS